MLLFALFIQKHLLNFTIPWLIFILDHNDNDIDLSTYVAPVKSHYNQASDIITDL